MVNVVPPCKNCDKRYLGCHATCLLYKQYTYEIEDIKTKERKWKMEREAQFMPKNASKLDKRIMN